MDLFRGSEGSALHPSEQRRFCRPEQHCPRSERVRHVLQRCPSPGLLTCGSTKGGHRRDLRPKVFLGVLTARSTDGNWRVRDANIEWFDLVHEASRENAPCGVLRARFATFSHFGSAGINAAAYSLSTLLGTRRQAPLGTSAGWPRGRSWHGDAPRAGHPWDVQLRATRGEDAVMVARVRWVGFTTSATPMRRDAGRPLCLPRAYLSRGIRERSQGLATRSLGLRSEHDRKLSRERAVTARHWNLLDSALESRMNDQREGASKPF